VRAAAAAADRPDETCRDCTVDGVTFDPLRGNALPARGLLRALYASTSARDELVFKLELDLAAPEDRAMVWRIEYRFVYSLV
jgi:hypothetical protein